MATRNYTGAFLKYWGAWMSGAASVIFGAWVVFFEPRNETVKTAFIWFAIGAAVATFYQIWAIEHRKVLALQERIKQGKPKLTGFFQHFEAYDWRKRDARDQDKDESGGVGIMIPLTHNPTGTLVVVQVRFVNDNPTPTTLHNFSLTIKVGDKTFTAIYPEELYEHEGWTPPELEAEENKKVYLVSYLDDPTKPAEQGRRIQGRVTFYFDGFMWQEFSGQDWLFILTITDAWGERHEITQWGEPPRKPQRNL